MTEKDYWILFSAFPEIGPARFSLLLKYFGSAEKAWKAPGKEYRKINLSGKLTEKFIEFKREFDVDSYFLRLRKLEIETLTSEDKNYPKRLRQAEDVPFVLYVLKSKNTSINLLQKPSIAVVGTRKMTAYGQKMTESLTSALVQFGMVIVSGLALGIDTVAHKKAIQKGGKTIAVLPVGLDKIYPRANTRLAREIVDSGGILVSEFPPFYPVTRQNFVIRNRIVSGLSLGVLVIEGAKRSGTLLTASFAAAQGREVFAVPGPITSPFSAAPNFLIRNGAKLVTSPEDIFEELEPVFRVRKGLKT